MRHLKLSHAAILACMFSGNLFAQTSLENDVKVLKRQISNLQNAKSQIRWAGYGSIKYTDVREQVGSFEVGSFSPIFQYLYSDKLYVESELEMTISKDDSESTEIGIEYFTFNYLLNDNMTFVAGKFLTPIGQFRQNLHPSWINKLSSAPIGFGHHGIAPISDVGVQLRGAYAFTDMRVNYALFAGNGPTLSSHDEGEIEIKYEAKNTATNDTKAVGGRLGFLPMYNLELGVSYSTANPSFENEIARKYSLVGADMSYQGTGFLKGFNLRGEYVKVELDAGGETDSEAKESTAYYVQAAYQMDKYEIVLRQSEKEAHSKKTTQFATGLNYLVASNIITKINYEFNRDLASTNKLTLELAVGF